MSKLDDSVISLYELQTGIKDALNLNFPDYVWVHAELSEVNIARNGHCYIELVEKKNEQVVAKTRATIWNFTFRMLQPYFESSTGYKFTSGIKVSLKVAVEFHEIYGLSLNVKDIDPTYTVGDIELQKRKILNRLEDDGIMDMNAELELPLVIQNIAVITSSTAAGYGDFEKQIHSNQYLYNFNCQLFEAKMQGVETGSSIVSALDQIYQKENEFDAVIIIRGGGSKMDLAGFDNYELAANVAQFPLPIFTGIGHERDESIADIVAHTSLKTPTAVAEFLITQIREFEARIEYVSSEIANTAQEIIEAQSHDLEMAIQKIQQLSSFKIQSNQNKLLIYSKQVLRETKNANKLANENLLHFSEQINYQSKRIVFRANEKIEISQNNLIKFSQSILEKSNRRINQIEHLNKAFDPKRTLERGFAMIEQNKKIITAAKNIKQGEVIKIIMQDGEHKII